MPTIYSTATNDNVITFYKKKSSSKTVSANKPEKSIIIKGSLNQETRSLRGKYGETEVTADELKMLKEHNQFAKGVERGFFSEKKPTEVKKDKSAQLDAKQVKAMTKAEAKTGKEEA